MAKKSAGMAHMSDAERLAGTIFFVVYLLVMPLLADRLFRLAEVLLDMQIDGNLQNALYYYFIFAVTLLIFHNYLFNTAGSFFRGAGRSLSSLALALLVFYGANELAYRVLRLLLLSRTNLNDVTIAAQVDAAPRTTMLIIVFLSPFVEEVLFRGLVFSCLREKSRVLAYAVSALLFAFHCVWLSALASWNFSHLMLTLQYLIPALVFAWAYDRSGTLWCPILLHMAVNALAYWGIV